MDQKILPRPATTSLDLVACPECQEAAKVEWHSNVYSTEGPVEVVKIMCLNRHCFLMPSATLRPL
jgi:hypothetical protein